jgi:hypothetical protein
MTYLLLPRATGVVVATWPNYAGQLCRVAPTVKRATESSRLSTRCRQVGLRRLLSGWLVVGGGSYLESRGRDGGIPGHLLDGIRSGAGGADDAGVVDAVYLAVVLIGLSGLVVGLDVDTQI